MKVVHIAHVFGLGNVGGAAIAASRLHNSLLRKGVDSYYIALWKKSNGDNVLVIPKEGSIIRRVFFYVSHALRKILTYLSRNRVVFPHCIFVPGLLSKIKDIDPDVVHIQWINYDTAAFEQLSKIRTVVRKECKVFINLHDLYLVLPEGGGGTQQIIATSKVFQG